MCLAFVKKAYHQTFSTEWSIYIVNCMNSFSKTFPTELFLNHVTVFLSRFGALLTSLFTFAQKLVQPPQHLVICAHHSSSFSFLPTNCKCFWTWINCFHTTLCCFI